MLEQKVGRNPFGLRAATRLSIRRGCDPEKEGNKGGDGTPKTSQRVLQVKMLARSSRKRGERPKKSARTMERNFVSGGLSQYDSTLAHERRPSTGQMVNPG